MAQVPDHTELESELALAMVPGIGPLSQNELVERFGTASRVLSASRKELISVHGIGRQLVDRVMAASVPEARAELDFCRRHNIRAIRVADPDYPSNLRTIDSRPPVLFCRGPLHSQDALAIAIVGTRHATQYGKRAGQRLSASLAAAGFTIVSGLARGIDAAAHTGALEAGGRTIAVMAGGLDRIYPPEHKDLAEKIADHGSILSEMPPRQPVHRGAFPRRNRVVTGMSLGVIVVEAGDRSGALISAQHAMAQGRDVFAVPGRIDSRVSRGCHALLRDGAILVESAEDVIDALGPLAEFTHRTTGEEVRHPAELKLNAQERCVLDFVQDEPTSIDQLAAASELPIHRVLATVSALESRHLIRRISGALVIRS